MTKRALDDAQLEEIVGGCSEDVCDCDQKKRPVPKIIGGSSGFTEAQTGTEDEPLT